MATAGPIVNQKYNNAETLIGNAACAGLAVMVIILSTGHISGAHLNPSLTIAFAALRHFPWVQVPAYIAAQVSASICASFALKGVFHPFMSGGVTVPSVSVGQAFALEFFITFILLFVVTAVATDTRAVGELAGIAVGATVMLNILVAGCLKQNMDKKVEMQVNKIQLALHKPREANMMIIWLNLTHFWLADILSC
ncbi:hypothetical protein OIU84_003217 [Salix udensis]|uniref:Uncharacterized protein n=1 Tax=Salix udensis TaxID=889485 RepID=A0AAD6K6B6_9ROSI|nr:hypothetical protein OIU84_003217 [Salix udensis]